MFLSANAVISIISGYLFKQILPLVIGSIFLWGSHPPLFFFCMTDTFNYFCFVYLASLGLHCCKQVSGCGELGLVQCGALAFHHRGFSCCGTQAVGVQVSVAAACGLQSAVSLVVAHRFSCPTACEIFSDQGANLCPPALADRFFTVGPPGKS